MKLYKHIFVAFLMLFAAVCAFAAQPAADFSLKDTNGKVVRLSDYKGKVVFLDFWASWCPPCRNSIPAIKNLHKEMSGNSNVIILGINAGESSNTVTNFIKKQGINYTVLYGNNTTMQNYSVNGIPAFFIIDKKGNIAKRYTGYSEGLEQDWYTQINNLLK